MLEIKDLSIEYKTRRGTARGVDSVFLKLPENQTLGLAGESGCGKSTLGRSIMRLVAYPGKIIKGDIIFNIPEDIVTKDATIERGHVNLMNLNEQEMRAIRGKEISYIFQDPMTSLNPMTTIGTHFIEIMKAHNPTIEDDEAIERAKEILESLGINPERITDYPHQFSGGMRQRVMIGLALILKPKLLIADEPTTSLDVIVEAQILEEVANLKKQFNLTMILITHNLGVLAQTADNIAIMYTSRVMELSPTLDLFEDPLHPYAQALLQSVPDVTQPEKQLAWIPGAPPDLIDPLPGCMYNPRCPYAMDICKTVVPQLTEVKDGRLVACHLFMEG
ncbi:ABC transporter ATP-binding protein [Candidatus Thorarchaeota archaeon]|nr:ABC transporter ATP-binding protein [Candidatus Thorarchaeota archaeon]TFG99133.1 MAG: ABC transporter ATP-binding protein [Candidatus Thorarchaeota archaeon]